jgi:predicted RNA-binding Zn ribbon-like protein
MPAMANAPAHPADDPLGRDAGRSPAPVELQPVQDFVNTKDNLFGREALGSAQDLANWLIGRGLIPPETVVSDADLQHVVAVREAVRTFISRDRAEPSDLEISILDDVGRRARLQWRFELDGNVRVGPSRGGVAGALGTILAPLLTAALTGRLERLKTCRNCRWMFYDYSKNRSGTWCSMDLCGSRVKAKRHYWRTRPRGGMATEEA